MTYIERLKGRHVLTLSESAQYLRVTRQTLARLINAGKIPAAKVGGQYRILRAALDDYLSGGYSRSLG